MLCLHCVISPSFPNGTLWRNLDPFDEHQGPTLNDALCSTTVFSVLEDPEEGWPTLDSLISGSGSNLSIVPKHVLALAQAMVHYLSSMKVSSSLFYESFVVYDVGVTRLAWRASLGTDTVACVRLPNGRYGRSIVISETPRLSSM